MNAKLADLAAAVMFAGVLTCWAQGYWPVALVEIGSIPGRRDLAGVGHHGAQADSRRVRAVSGLRRSALGHSAACHRPERVSLRNRESRALVGRLRIGLFGGSRGVRPHAGTRTGCFARSCGSALRSACSRWCNISPPKEKSFGYSARNRNACWARSSIRTSARRSWNWFFRWRCINRWWTGGSSLLYVAMAATMFAAVIAAVSRAGVLIVVGELIAILLFAWFRGLMPAGKLWKTVVWAAALSVVLAAVVGWQVTLQKFREPEPYRVRRELLFSSLAMMADRPWTGFGLGTWPAVYPAYARFDNGLAANHAHNDWAEWAAEGGLPFVALAGDAGHLEHPARGRFALGHWRARGVRAQPGGLSAARAGARRAAVSDAGRAGRQEHGAGDSLPLQHRRHCRNNAGCGCSAFWLRVRIYRRH